MPRDENRPSQVREIAPNRTNRILHQTLVLALIVAGADKFAMLLVDWTTHLAPQVAQSVSVRPFLQAVGTIEIFAGLVVALRPALGAYVACVWLVANIANVVAAGAYGTALWYAGLALGALALTRIARSESASAAPRTGSAGH